MLNIRHAWLEMYHFIDRLIKFSPFDKMAAACASRYQSAISIVKEILNKANQCVKIVG